MLVDLLVFLLFSRSVLAGSGFRDPHFIKQQQSPDAGELTFYLASVRCRATHIPITITSVLLCTPALIWPPCSVSSCYRWHVQDTHLGQVSSVRWTALERNTWVVSEMHRTPGLPWPEALGGGLVAEPEGVVFTGDLIDAGSDTRTCEEQVGEIPAPFHLGGHTPVKLCVDQKASVARC